MAKTNRTKATLKSFTQSCLLYVYCEDEFGRYQGNSSYIVVQDEKKKLRVPFHEDHRYYTKLNNILFDNSHVIMTWKFKQLVSQELRHLKRIPDINADIFDLSILENMFDIRERRPKNFYEAQKRLKILVQKPNWKSQLRIYKTVYKPLMLEVLPKIESRGFYTRSHCFVYPTYQIEGTVNGRLNSIKANKNSTSFNPHVLTPDKLQQFIPFKHNSNFLVFDYKNMDATILQWLTNDSVLKNALEGGDFYKSLWEAITENPFKEEYRKFSKPLFISIIYGQGRSGVAKSLNISKGNASKIIDEMRKKLSSFRLMESMTVNEQGLIRNYFGRIRKFVTKDQTKVRNFYIQSVSALINLDKLVKLHYGINDHAKLIASVHDGYYLAVHDQAIDKVVEIGKQILEAEEDFYPGLKLKVSVKVGKSLADLQEYNYAGSQLQQLCQN